jgi:hypothetical protein
MTRGKTRHIDSAVNRRLESLFESLEEFQRVTTRAATVIVLPHRHDEPAIVWENGQVVVGVDPVACARAALEHRAQSEKAEG